MFTLSFYARRSQKCKNSVVKLSVSFALLGSMHIKAANKIMIKFTPVGQVFNLTWICKVMLNQVSIQRLLETAVINDYPRNLNIVVFVDRWSLFRSTFML